MQFRQGVKVTPDEITELVKSLGLDDGDANDLISGLDFSAPTDAKSTPKPLAKIQTTQTLPEVRQDEGEEDPDDSDSDSDSLPPIDSLKGARKRTDERPLPSPLTPSGSNASTLSKAGDSMVKGTPSPKKA